MKSTIPEKPTRLIKPPYRDKSGLRNIYPTDEGVAIIVPAPECGLTIEEIAAKDVPAGKPFKIVDVADIPTDRTFRNAWEYTA